MLNSTQKKKRFPGLSEKRFSLYVKKICNRVFTGNVEIIKQNVEQAYAGRPGCANQMGTRKDKHSYRQKAARFTPAF